MSLSPSLATVGVVTGERPAALRFALPGVIGLLMPASRPGKFSRLLLLRAAERRFEAESASCSLFGDLGEVD